MMCHLLNSPPSILVLLQSNETRLWSLGIALGWLAFLVGGICLWRFLPVTSPWRRSKVLLGNLLVFWYLQSAQLLQAHNCPLAAVNSLSAQYDHAYSTFEFVTSVAVLGSFLAVAICLIALDFWRIWTAVTHYVSAMLNPHIRRVDTDTAIQCYWVASYKGTRQ